MRIREICMSGRRSDCELGELRAMWARRLLRHFARSIRRENLS